MIRLLGKIMMSTRSSHLVDRQVNLTIEIITGFRIISVSKIAHKAFHSKVFCRFESNIIAKMAFFTYKAEKMAQRPACSGLTHFR